MSAFGMMIMLDNFINITEKNHAGHKLLLILFQYLNIYIVLRLENMSQNVV